MELRENATNTRPRNHRESLAGYPWQAALDEEPGYWMFTGSLISTVFGGKHARSLHA